MIDWIKDNYKKITIGVVIIAVLTTAFFFGGQSEPNHNTSVVTEQSNTSKTNSNSNSELSADESKEDIKEMNSAVSSTEPSEIISVTESSKSVSENSTESSIPSKSESADTIVSSSTESSVESSIYETAQPSDEKPKESVTSQNSQPKQSSKNTSSKSERSRSSETKQKTFESSDEKKIRQIPKTSTTTEKSNITQEASNPVTVSEPSAENQQGNLSCTLTISCATAINSSSLSRAKRSVLPEDGMILNHAKVYFNEGDSAYDVISKVCKENNIHFDAVTTPLTGGKYVKGINNLYEYDCGNVSGWMYRVNGEFPNIGCSEYYLSDGDEVAFLYSCNLGEDIGNIYKGE